MELTENGWIMPDGTFITCDYGYHDICAREVLKMDVKKLETRAIRVSCMSLEHAEFWDQPHAPETSTFRRTPPTKAQLRTLERYFVTFGFRPTALYLNEVEGNWKTMTTEEILAVLAT
ncbi:MAG: hypothetical protein HGA67_03660 [Candidatus Yonathbacteria bacterium]|nr:hypothetical protein [Candidatus Yonathbacteria bacterium]